MKTRRWLWIAIALLVLAGAGLGVYLWWQQSSTPTKLPPTVVLVFAMPGEDGTAVAQLVATLDTVKGTYTVADPNAEVAVPGTSYTRLRDAYPFGGAKLVASTLLGSKADSAGWVDVSPAAWKRLLTAGFDVDLKEEFQAFDNATDRYSQFELGPQHVSVDDLSGFVNGLPYTGTTARMAGEQQLAKASLRALVAAQTGDGVSTSVDARLWPELAAAIGSAHPVAE